MPNIWASQSEVKKGFSFTVYGDRFTPKLGVSLAFYSDGYRKRLFVRTDQWGKFRIALIVPLKVSVGTYHVQARDGRTKEYSNTVDIEVLPYAMFTITIQVSGKGTTSPSPGTYTYDPSVTPGLKITAIPESQNEFVQWTGVNGLSTFNPVTIGINKNYSITAQFREILYPTCKVVLFTAAPNATITLGGVSYGNKRSVYFHPVWDTSIQASDVEGYRFSSWSKDGRITFGSSTAKSTTVKLVGSGSITANYVKT